MESENQLKVLARCLELAELIAQKNASGGWLDDERRQLEKELDTLTQGDRTLLDAYADAHCRALYRMEHGKKRQGTVQIVLAWLADGSEYYGGARGPQARIWNKYGDENNLKAAIAYAASSPLAPEVLTFDLEEIDPMGKACDYIRIMTHPHFRYLLS